MIEINAASPSNPLHDHFTPTMDDTTSRDFQPQKQTVFKCANGWVYRIPALLYERESETLLAFAEQRLNVEDTSTKNLIMSTGTLKKEDSSDVRTIEVIIVFLPKVLVSMEYCF